MRRITMYWQRTKRVIVIEAYLLLHTRSSVTEQDVFLYERVHVVHKQLKYTRAQVLGLHVNWSKTKLQSFNPWIPTPLSTLIGTQPVATTDNFTYLGSTIASNNSPFNDVNRRIAIATSTMSKLSSLWTSSRLHTCQSGRGQMTEIFPIDDAQPLTGNGRRACNTQSLTAVAHSNRTLVSPIMSHRMINTRHM